jgi:signal transduction histidine kinase
LNVAQSRVQLAQEECGSDHLADVASAHDRMESLIENVLTLSRVEKQTVEKEPVALEKVSQTCWQTVSTADATLVADIDRHLQADRSRLQQLLENLIRNAIEHAGETVTVTVGELETKTGFYVEDDGPGIPPEKRPQVFKTGTSTAYDGTGLGLSIVEQIVEAHDWQIELTDGADDGARFEIKDVEFSQ